MTDDAYAQQFSVSAITRPEEVATVIKAIVRVAQSWGLSDQEGAALFDVSQATWSKMGLGTFYGSLDQTLVIRASLIVGIYKDLRETFYGPLALGWPCFMNKGPLFSGGRPVEFMIRGGIPALVEIRRHIHDTLSR